MGQLLSSPEERGLASVKPRTSFHLQKQNKSLDRTILFLRHPHCRQTLPVSFTDLLGEREREKDGEDEDLHPSQPVRVQVVYKV